ncbi:hypothetical protein BCR33DRAFT_735090 [Rhizoclosmatium globosum]|uniref:FAD-binding FR-type domain-containing protein n=1 Tax=Rhizoclosmatium globosum TaxID=329046 RepID=A0A1Y2CR97_9FUNG|nr:hypothetical protein BCR33DRAFT_735090 [Rhizoclosmatium globosum]|eukprot:ORY48875.1 hypothetical protein BCR33DRAFT_735090 [Rhizoclosmatium globosum]
MKYTPGQLAFGASSLLIFPASAIFTYYLIDNRSWCLADMCVDKTMANIGPTMQQTLFVYYGFLALAIASIETIRRIPRAQRLVSRPVTKSSSITVGELTWFILTLLVSFGIAAMGFMFWWNRGIAKAKGKPLDLFKVTISYLFNSSGDVVAVLMGFVMIPASKNSFLATFFGLPYNAMTRVHIWIGRAIWWMTVFHVVDGIIKYLYNKRDPLNMIRVPAGAEWGEEGYMGACGVVATVALLIVVITSMDFFRRKWFNTFFYTHFLVFVFIAFAYFHASNCIYYILPGLLMYAIDGFIRLHSRFNHKDKIKSVIFEDCSYITLTVSTKKASTSRPGEFMRVCFPEVSKFEFHPWSIASADSETVTFLFATVGENKSEWTWKLHSLLLERQAAGTLCEIDVCLQGPYGNEIEFVKTVGVVGKTKPAMYVFYVGGTGVAASIKAIEKVLLSNDDAKVLLVWSARVSGIEHLSLLKGLIAEGRKESRVNFIVELYNTYGGVAAIDMGTESYIDSKRDEKNLVEVGLASYQLYHQRSDFLSILQKHVSVLDLDVSIVEVGVFVCGSAGFVKHALESVSQFQQENKNVHIDLVVEPFAL